MDYWCCNCRNHTTLNRSGGCDNCESQQIVYYPGELHPVYIPERPPMSREGLRSAIVAVAITLGIICVILILSCLPGWSQEKPEKPKPTIDREFVIDSGAMAAAWALDTISTREALGRCSACFEGGAFFPGSRNTAKIMGAWAAIDVAAFVASYEWKQHVRNRYLRPFWRAFMAQRIYGHMVNAAENFKVK